jgi:hypothetical protein
LFALINVQHSIFKTFLAYLVLTFCLDISLITALDDHQAIGDFFGGFAFRP